MLKVEQIKKDYGDFTLECSLEVKVGHITGLVGQNGAGKSTTFKAVLGLIHTDSGRICFQDKEIRKLTEADRCQIGVALSDAGFCDQFQIRDIVPIMEQFYPDFDREWFTVSCKQFGLPYDKRLKEFSRGMQAKLRVLIALSHHASLLLLDEPTAGLDIIARDEILSLLRQFMEQEGEHAILISSHISSDLEGLCDDIYMIHQGRIILHEDMDVLLGEYGLLRVSPEQYALLDKDYLIRVQETPYGYQCLTGQRQFYLENYPDIVVEKGSLDEIIPVMVGGSALSGNDSHHDRSMEGKH